MRQVGTSQNSPSSTQLVLQKCLVFLPHSRGYLPPDSPQRLFHTSLPKTLPTPSLSAEDLTSYFTEKSKPSGKHPQLVSPKPQTQLPVHQSSPPSLLSEQRRQHFHCSPVLPPLVFQILSSGLLRNILPATLKLLPSSTTTETFLKSNSTACRLISFLLRGQIS